MLKGGFKRFLLKFLNFKDKRGRNKKKIGQEMNVYVFFQGYKIYNF